MTVYVWHTPLSDNTSFELYHKCRQIFLYHMTKCFLQTMDAPFFEIIGVLWYWNFTRRYSRFWRRPLIEVWNMRRQKLWWWCQRAMVRIAHLTRDVGLLKWGGEDLGCLKIMVKEFERMVLETFGKAFWLSSVRSKLLCTWSQGGR